MVNIRCKKTKQNKLLENIYYFDAEYFLGTTLKTQFYFSFYKCSDGKVGADRADTFGALREKE